MISSDRKVISKSANNVINFGISLAVTQHPS